MAEFMVWLPCILPKMYSKLTERKALRTICCKTQSLVSDKRCTPCKNNYLSPQNDQLCHLNAQSTRLSSTLTCTYQNLGWTPLFPTQRQKCLDMTFTRLINVNKTSVGFCAQILSSYLTEFLSDISKISNNGFHQLWLKILVSNLKSIIICTVCRPPDTPLDPRLCTSEPRLVKVTIQIHYDSTHLVYSGLFWKYSTKLMTKLYAFYLLFNLIVDHHAPIGSIKVSGKPNPCITEKIGNVMKSRNKWHRRACIN